jgi:putative two-component system response regulator
MLISVLSEIVEFRNGESGMHVLNINILTTMILEQLVKKTDKYPLSWSNRMLISTASSLHDIGKIGIDEKILNKPGRLTPEERKIMEKHTVIGADMLANLQMYEDEPLMKVAYQICRWHHERYDGKGYPDGLKGEEIPISAQVVALADVYDALTSERVYKKAYSHEEAVQMICNGECGTFNPLLLECLCEIQDPIKKELQEAAYRSEMSDPERKNKKFEHYDNSQKKFFGAVTQAIEKEYGTAGEELSRMKTEEEK